MVERKYFLSLLTIVIALWGLGCQSSKSEKRTALQYKQTIVFLQANFSTKKVRNDSYVKKLQDVFIKDGRFQSEIDEGIYYILLANCSFADSGQANAVSGQYYSKALHLLESAATPQNVQVWAMVNYGWYAYRNIDLQKALNLYTSAMHMLSTMPADCIIDGIHTYKWIGYYLGTIDETKLAIQFLKKVLDFCDGDKDISVRAEILDNIGMYYGKQDDYVTAQIFLDSAMIYARKAKDSLRMAKILGNEAHIYNFQKRYKEAIPLLLEDVRISALLKDTANLTISNHMLSNAYAGIGEEKKASVHLDSALVLAKHNRDFQSNEFTLLKSKLDLIKQFHLTKDTTAILLRINMLRDIIDTTDGQNAIRMAKLGYVNHVYAQKKDNAAQSLAKERKIKRLYAVFASLLLAVIFFVVRWYKRHIKRKERSFDAVLQKLDMEKVHSEQKLAKAKQDVASYVVYLNERNRQISELKQELEKLKEKELVSSSSIANNQLDEILNRPLITDADWKNFKRAFIQENATFYEKLQKEYPGLTDSNMRIVFLSKLNLSNQEIANVLGLSYDAIKKAKQRLKGKFGADLVAFLSE